MLLVAALLQEIRLLGRQVEVMPGEALLTTCTYNTADRPNVTLGGFGFTEEMCVNYVHYYPRSQVEVCKSTISPSSLDSYFTSLVAREDQPLQGLQGFADR